jgi:hypothetical protein
MIDISLGALALAAMTASGVVFACLTAVLAKVSSDEVSGWLPVWSAHLLDSAVAIVPLDYQERYREEWRAELAAFEGRGLSALRFAWRLRRRARLVREALCEVEGLRGVFEPEPPPVELTPLDATAVAAIVRKAVEKSGSRDPWKGQEVIEALRASLEGLDVEQRPAEITQRYLTTFRDWREEERKAPQLGKIDWSRDPFPGWGPKSARAIAEDVARRQRASEKRRRPGRRRRLGYWR